MSVSYYCPIVYGIFLSQNLLQQTTEYNVRGCGHSIVEGAKFCSECGSPIFKNVKVTLRDRIDTEELEKLGFVVAENELAVTQWGSINEGGTNVSTGLIIGVIVPVDRKGLIEFTKIDQASIQKKLSEKITSLNIKMDVIPGLYRAVSAS